MLRTCTLKIDRVMFLHHFRRQLLQTLRANTGGIFNVFGERQEIANEGESLVLARFLAQYKREEPFTIYGTGEQRRDFVYVGDVVDANLLAAEYLDKAKEFQIIDIGTGINYSINEVAEMIDKDNPRVNLPPRDEPFENRANINKAQELLNWNPTVDLPTWLRSL